MPIYEYRCGACGHELEALQKMSDSPLRKCPECGKAQLRRLVSAPAFRLKGGGWYETDFKGDGEKKRNLVESGGGSDSSDSASKSDSDSSSKDSGAKEATAKIAEAKGAAKPPAKPASKPKPVKAAPSKVAPAKVAKKTGAKSARG
jgi:putative FmdB family regulatory protein